MGAEQSRSHELVLKAAAGDVEGVRRLLGLYIHQQRNQILLAQTPANQRVDINHALPEGDFALELATTHGHVLVVQLLLEHGANVDQQDADGLTALMCAVHESATPVTLQLLRLGKASLDIQDRSGDTALHHAAKLGHVAQVQLLLSHRAALTTRNKEGDNALDVAAKESQWAVVKAILLHLQSLALADERQASMVQGALLPAANAAQWDVVQLLLACGADTSARLPSGGKIIDLLPSFVLLTLPSVCCTRRADAIIRSLYDFLTSSILEVVLEYDEEAYDPPGSVHCVGMSRILAHLRGINEEQDRLAAEKRREAMAKALTSKSSGVTSPLSAASSDSGGGASGTDRASPSASGLSVSGNNNGGMGGGGGGVVSSNGLAPPSMASSRAQIGSSPHSQQPSVSPLPSPADGREHFVFSMPDSSSDATGVSGEQQLQRAEIPPTLRSAIEAHLTETGQRDSSSGGLEMHPMGSSATAAGGLHGIASPRAEPRRPSRSRTSPSRSRSSKSRSSRTRGAYAAAPLATGPDSDSDEDTARKSKMRERTVAAARLD